MRTFLRSAAFRPEAHSPRAGFTLVEVLIAMFILSIGLVGIWSLFPVGIDSVARNQGALFASDLARTKLALAQRMPAAVEIAGTSDLDLITTNDTVPGDKAISVWEFYDAAGKLTRRQFDLPESGVVTPSLLSGETTRTQIQTRYKYSIEKIGEVSYTSVVGSPKATKKLKITVKWGHADRLKWIFVGEVTDLAAAFY